MRGIHKEHNMNIWEAIMTAREKLAALRSSIARIEGRRNAFPEGPEEGPEGGLAGDGLHDLYTRQSRDAGAATGFALALLAERLAKPGGGCGGVVLWIADRRSRAESGGLCGAGLAAFGLDPDRFAFLVVDAPREVLWAMEQGLEVAGLAGVVAEFRGNGVMPDPTATRRLALRARSAGTFGIFLRFGAAPLQGATVRRWRVSPAPGSHPEDDGMAPGRPAWRLVLEKNRHGPPAELFVEWNRHDNCLRRLDVGTPQGDAGAAHPGALSAKSCNRPPRPAGTGEIMARRW